MTTASLVRVALAVAALLVIFLAVTSTAQPIPGTRRRECIDENAAATQVALSADDLADLNTLVDRIGVAGNRYDENGMRMVGR